MKKFIISLCAFAGLFATSCVKEQEMLIFDPSTSVAPVLEVAPTTVLSKDGAAITISYTELQLSIAAPKTQELYASITEDFNEATKVTASFGKTEISVKASDLNSALLNLGATVGEEFTVYLRVSAWMANDKGKAIASSLSVSNITVNKFTPYDQLMLEKDVFGHVWVLGNYCDWAHDKAQFLYNYNGDGQTFTGVVDFGDKTADGFKFTDAADWDHGNWGSSEQTETAEQESIQLVNGSGSQNIICLSHRFYNFTFNTNTLVLVPGKGFDTVGMTGTIADWKAENAVPMEYNADFVRFWVDYEFANDEQIKFVADGAWDLNWGAKAVPGGDNINVSAGNYRVYFKLNDGTITFDSGMYGKPEPTATPASDEPAKPASWSIAGTIGGNGWTPDAGTMNLTNIGGDTWVIRSLEIAAGDEFKICADNDWPGSLGGPEANSKSTIDSANPYDVYKATIGETFAAGDKNIQVAEAGLYDITIVYSAEGSTVRVDKHVAAYSIIGEINGDKWSNDVVMTEKDGIWTSPIVTISGGFKIRYDYSWDADKCYGFAPDQSFALDTDITLVQPGDNITVPAEGDYKITFNPATNVVRITQPAFPENLYMIGAEFGAWDWNNPGVVEMVPVHPNAGEAQFWTIRYFTAGQGFKYNSKKEWGGDFHSLTTNDGYTEEGGNCVVAEDGFYMVHIDLKNEKVHIEPARVYGMSATFGNPDWTEELEASKFAVDGKTMTATIAADGEIRIYAASSIAPAGNWWTREFIFFDGKIAYRGAGGDQARVSGTAGQKVILDFNAGTAKLQ